MEQFLDYFVPENYILDLKIDKIAKTIGGKVTIKGAAKASKIKFHAPGLSVDEVKANGKNVDFELVDGVLTLNKVPRSDLTLELVYNGSLNENMEGAYLSTYQYKKQTEIIVATQFESHYAREAFPCIDEPAAKATFDLKITVPEHSTEDIILANTPIKSTKTAKSGDKITTFETTPRMSTYLLAFVIGKFHGKTITNAHGVEITTYAPLNQPLGSVDFANEVAAKSLEYYDNEFGVPYPLPKCDQVALPDFEAGAMENWGLVTYRESMLLADKTATIGTKKSVALTVSHELSHQWFGDLVTMKWWDDLWLNESFASIMEYMAIDSIYPHFQIWENFFTGDCLSALRRDAYRDVQSVQQPVHNPAEIATLFDGAIVYSKGARLMLMLIRAMGWNNFKKGIKDYFEKFAYQNTSGDDLWSALKPYADFDPKSFMHYWIKTPGYPVLSGKNHDKQSRFLLDGKLEKSHWPIEHISGDMSGHYIINLSSEEFDDKLNYFNALDLEEKLRLLIDRDLLAKAGLVPSASLLDLVSKFKQENSAAIWGIILNIIAGLKIFFDPNSEEEKLYKHFVCDLIADKLAAVGTETRPDDDDNTIRLRAILLGLAYYAEDKPILSELASRYTDDLTSLDPELRADIINAKIYCDPSILDEYLAKYQETADPELKFDLSFAMTLTKNHANIDKLVKLLDQPGIVKPQDHLFFFVYLYRNAEASAKVFDWLEHSWDYVKKLAGDKTIEEYPRYMANSIRDGEIAKKFFDFFEPKTQDPALSRALKIARSEIDARLKLIQDNKKAVYDRLK